MKTGKRILSLVLCAAVIYTASMTCFAEEPAADAGQAELQQETGFMSYSEYISANSGLKEPKQEIKLLGKDYSTSGEDCAKVLEHLDNVANPLRTESQGYVEWEFEVPEEGLYGIEINYYPLEGKGSEIEREFRINGEIPYSDLETVGFKRIYQNKSDEFEKDPNGNHLRPVQIEAPAFQQVVLAGSNYNANEVLKVKLHQGKNTLRITSIKEPMAIDYIRFFNADPLPGYQEVKSQYPQSGQTEVIHIEGEDAALKSDAVLYPSSDRTSPATSPTSLSHIIINTIGGTYWAEPKQWIQWDFKVEKAGLYRLNIRGKQDQNPGIVSYRKLMIDGEVPFAEANEIAFNYKTGWQMFEIGDETNGSYLFYFEEGMHSIRLENNVGHLSTLLEQLNRCIVQLNACYRQVFMLTGSYPDADRDYNLEISLPGLKDQLKQVSEELRAVNDAFFELTGTKGTGYSEMEKMQIQLESFIEDMETIPARLDNFRTNISNLSDFQLTATNQPLLIDWLEFVPENAETPKADAGFFEKLWFEVKSFFISFFVDYNSIGSAETEIKEKITLWLNSTAQVVGTGRDQAQAIQALVDNDFTKNKGIGVDIRLVDVSVLLPAVSSGRGPDTVVGLASAYPMNYAYRNAVCNLSEFPDIDEILPRFYPEALTPFRYQDEIYALPDKYTFYMMFYRTDILNELGLEVPETWQDVYEILPQLQNKYMEIGVPNLADNSIDLFTTLLFQQGGNVYDEALTKSTLDSEASIEAFKQFTDLYTKYKVSQKINHTTRFRTGEAPIVFMPYTFYTTLQAAAPEINGLWDFARMPGTVKEDGSIDHTASATATGALIFSNSKHKNEAWEFLKWWTSAEVQAAYGIEVENIQGPAGRYAPATMEAMEKLPWSAKELETIMEAYENTKAVAEAPGGYMTVRYVVTAATLVINNGLIPRESIIDHNKMINDEVQAMRKKFGLKQGKKE